MKKFDVFISYANQDKLAALAACKKLEAAGMHCWIAPRDVAPGAEWAAAIVDAIKNCRLMVLIFSSNANQSQDVRREVQLAFKNEIPVVVFRIEDTDPTGTLGYYLTSVQWLDAQTAALEEHLEPLVAFAQRQVPEIRVGGIVPAFFEGNDNIGSPTVVVHPPTLERSLYVADIRLTFDDLEQDRYIELMMRVFNGSGRVVGIGNLSGQIKYNTPNNTDPNRMGDLPTPALHPDVKRTAVQLEEWLLVFVQRVPATEADKLLAMLKTDIPILFDLTGLNIEVFAQNNRTKVERLPLWDGVTYKRGLGFGRLIAAVAHM